MSLMKAILKPIEVRADDWGVMDDDEDIEFNDLRYGCYCLDEVCIRIIEALKKLSTSIESYYEALTLVSSEFSLFYSFPSNYTSMALPVSDHTERSRAFRSENIRRFTDTLQTLIIRPLEELRQRMTPLRDEIAFRAELFHKYQHYLAKLKTIYDDRDKVSSRGKRPDDVRIERNESKLKEAVDAFYVQNTKCMDMMRSVYTSRLTLMSNLFSEFNGARSDLSDDLVRFITETSYAITRSIESPYDAETEYIQSLPPVPAPFWTDVRRHSAVNLVSKGSKANVHPKAHTTQTMVRDSFSLGGNPDGLRLAQSSMSPMYDGAMLTSITANNMAAHSNSKAASAASRMSGVGDIDYIIRMRQGLSMSHGPYAGSPLVQNDWSASMTPADEFYGRSSFLNQSRVFGPTGGRTPGSTFDRERGNLKTYSVSSDSNPHSRNSAASPREKLGDPSESYEQSLDVQEYQLQSSVRVASAGFDRAVSLESGALSQPVVTTSMHHHVDNTPKQEDYLMELSTTHSVSVYDDSVSLLPSDFHGNRTSFHESYHRPINNASPPPTIPLPIVNPVPLPLPTTSSYVGSGSPFITSYNGFQQIPRPGSLSSQLAFERNQTMSTPSGFHDDVSHTLPKPQIVCEVDEEPSTFKLNDDSAPSSPVNQQNQHKSDAMVAKESTRPKQALTSNTLLMKGITPRASDTKHTRRMSAPSPGPSPTGVYSKPIVKEQSNFSYANESVNTDNENTFSPQAQDVSSPPNSLRQLSQIPEQTVADTDRPTQNNPCTESTDDGSSVSSFGTSQERLGVSTHGPFSPSVGLGPLVFGASSPIFFGNKNNGNQPPPLDTRSENSTPTNSPEMQQKQLSAGPIFNQTNDIVAIARTNSDVLPPTRVDSYSSNTPILSPMAVTVTPKNAVILTPSNVATSPPPNRDPPPKPTRPARPGYKTMTAL